MSDFKPGLDGVIATDTNVSYLDVDNEETKSQTQTNRPKCSGMHVANTSPNGQSQRPSAQCQGQCQ